MDKGIDTLHHANTVQTACLFLQHGRLLSRGTVVDRGLLQTPQISDALDQRFGIWNDVFLDSVDIHKRASQRNLYGPVLFCFALDLLLEPGNPTVWISQKNPTDWKEWEEPGDRYFSSVEQFAEKYSKGDFGSMFMFRHVGGILSLKPHLRDIVVDGPTLRDDGVDLYSHTLGALRLAAWQGGLGRVEIRRRECSSSCKCAAQYEALMKEEDQGNLKRLFVFGGDDAPYIER